MKVRKMKVRIPTVVFDCRGTDSDVVQNMLDGIEHLEARVRVLGAEVDSLRSAFSLEEATEHADIWVFCGKKLPKDFEMLMKRGIVPVMQNGSRPDALNYDPSQEEGNAFLYPKHNAWYIYGALVRALENHSFPYDWKNLKNHVKEFAG